MPLQQLETAAQLSFSRPPDVLLDLSETPRVLLDGTAISSWKQHVAC
jgi:hypothetical protein